MDSVKQVHVVSPGQPVEKRIFWQKVLRHSEVRLQWCTEDLNFWKRMVEFARAKVERR